MAKKKGDKKQQKNQKGKEGRDFKIGNPENEIEKIIEANSKFQIGNTGYDFHLIKRLKPVSVVITIKIMVKPLRNMD